MRICFSKNDSQIFCAAIAAPLNPAYKKDEFKFYLEDIKAKVVLVPSNNEAQPAREAAKELNIPIWEISFTHSGSEVHVNLHPLDNIATHADAKAVSFIPDNIGILIYDKMLGGSARKRCRSLLAH